MCEFVEISPPHGVPNQTCGVPPSRDKTILRLQPITTGWMHHHQEHTDARRILNPRKRPPLGTSVTGADIAMTPRLCGDRVSRSWRSCCSHRP